MATGVGLARARPPRALTALGALVLAVASASAAPGPARAAPARVPGIDVSKWQGTIDWADVSGTNIRFVIARSTIGDWREKPALSVDPRYLEYVDGATAEGFVVGAYHRAHVDRSEGDAQQEADFFVDLSRIEAGDVLPVIDIEEPHGLSVTELREWVKAWVRRVAARTGVKPLVYTGPYFWRTYLGDATWFADHGYPLWIANWGVAAPDVPAGNWSGDGWTYWQWDVTGPGSVPGISTDIDRDRFVGPDLVHGTIASLTVAPTAGGVVTGPRIRCGGTAARCERLANPDTAVTLTAAPDAGASLLGWTGACGSAGASSTCDVALLGDVATWAVFGYPLEVHLQGSGGGTVTSSPSGIACGASCTGTFPAGASVTLEAVADSASAFASWAGACAGTSPTCTVAVTELTQVTATFDSVVEVQEDGPGTRFGWGRAQDPVAIGGSYRWERRAGASVAFDVSGRAMTLWIVAGPSMGKGRVWIDGAPVARFDGFARSRERRHLRFVDLGPGDHRLAVQALGTKRAAATGTRVAVDALRWGGVLHPNPSGAGAWASGDHPAASGGSFVISDAEGASARLAFDGTGVAVGVLRGPTMGRAEIRVDGTLIRVVDLYAATRMARTIDVIRGLPDGRHVVVVTVSGSHRAASAGSAVTIDRWIVR
jgi:GH25 family lysozyme M1 (1,4-beta-N-acetylmuramidase)